MPLKYKGEYRGKAKAKRLLQTLFSLLRESTDRQNYNMNVIS